MAEDKKELQRQFEAFNEAGAAGDWDKVIQLGEALRTEFPDSFSDNKQATERLATAYYDRGNSFHNLKQYERNIKDYNKAIELKPDYANAYNNRGISYHDLKQYERAIEDYDKAIELKPDYANAYYNRGTNYNDLKQYERAIEDFDIAIELKPDYASAYNNRGVSYNGLELYEHAIADYDKAIELDPEHAAAYHNRGNSYLGLELYERIRTDYDKAIDMARTAEIDERIQRRRKASRKRLRSLRKYKGVFFVLLIIAAPFLWFYVSG